MRKAALLAVKFDPDYNSWCLEEDFDFDAVEDDEYIRTRDNMNSQEFN